MKQPLISLCLIAGNEEMHVRRCLKIFKPCCDELIVVRAIGSLAPDSTLDIAEHEFGAICGEYKNAPENADWPHVDNFAAARNMAFGMARGKFQLWVDFDDIADPDHVEMLRLAAEQADEAKWDVLLLPYAIPYSGATPPRERLVRRGCGIWVNAVHECIKWAREDVRYASNEQIIITHAPLINKVKTGDSSRRNLRILESLPKETRTETELFYLHQELMAVGRMEDSIAAAKVAIEHPHMGPSEKYEIFLNLSRIATTPKDRVFYLHEAVKTEPDRREALALLTAEATNALRPGAALAYARMMQAIPRPKRKIYSERTALYSWLGDSIFASALRLNGHKEQADALELLNFKRGGAKISLLHPSRGRGVKAQFTRKLWFDMAQDPGSIEHIFAIDEEDTDGRAAMDFLRHVLVPKGSLPGCVAGWNAAAAASHGQVLVCIADDLHPFIGWDRAILERLGDLSAPKVLAVSDGHRKDTLITHAILTRARYEQQGRFVYHPKFKSVYCDNYLTWKAYKDGCVVEARDLVFDHQHPAFAAGPMDQTYAVSNSAERLRHGRQVYMELTGEDVPLVQPLEESWANIEGFFNFPDIYDDALQSAPAGAKLLEIGTALGKSAAYMGQRIKDTGKAVTFYSVDHFKGSLGEATIYPEDMEKRARENLERVGVAKFVQIHASESTEFAKNFADGSLHFVFIDGGHDYESCRADIAAWAPKVGKGGILAGHDYASSEGVRKAVDAAFPDRELIRDCWRVRL